MRSTSTLIINYRTPLLIERAVRSFANYYPDIPLHIIDNGSGLPSKSVLEALNDELEMVKVTFLEENIFHGPAMDYGIKEATTDRVFVMDSDAEVTRAGFLEEMNEVLDRHDEYYGAGMVFHVNERGFKEPNGLPVLMTAHMLLRKNLYDRLPPFIHHGQPTIRNFKAAQDRGYRFYDYPIGKFVAHEGRGTASKFGYQLGLRGKIDYLLNKIGF